MTAGKSGLDVSLIGRMILDGGLASSTGGMTSREGAGISHICDIARPKRVTAHSKIREPTLVQRLQR